MPSEPQNFRFLGFGSSFVGRRGKSSAIPLDSPAAACYNLLTMNVKPFPPVWLDSASDSGISGLSCRDTARESAKRDVGGLTEETLLAGFG